MRKGIFGGVAALLAIAGMATAQTPTDSGDDAGARQGEEIHVASRQTESNRPTPAGATPPRDQPGRGTVQPEKIEAAPSPAPTEPSAAYSGPPAAPCVDGGDCCDSVGWGSRCWVNVDYLWWWTKRRDLPPLVTTGDPASQGILGQPGTQILFGGPIRPEENGRSGIRVMAGTWLGCEQTCGIEVGAFYFPSRDDHRILGSDLCTFLARPFFNLNDCVESSEITSQQGLARGSTHVRTPLDFWGAEINSIHKLCFGCAYRFDFLAGFRYLDLDEAVGIDELIRVEEDLPPEFSEFDRFAGATITVRDRFATRNRFYGGQVGLDGAFASGPWQVGVRGKVGLGVTRQTIDISGSQTIVFPNGVQNNFNGGLLALASNIGRHNDNEFSVVPEIGVNLGYRFNECVLAYVGYSFLYWSRVARAGDQIDRVVDVTQIPNFAPPDVRPTGFSRPAVLFAQSDFWAQGLNFGVELSW
jgi:hypothetical protein